MYGAKPYYITFLWSSKVFCTKGVFYWFGYYCFVSVSDLYTDNCSKYLLYTSNKCYCGSNYYVTVVFYFVIIYRYSFKILSRHSMCVLHFHGCVLIFPWTFGLIHCNSQLRNHCSWSPYSVRYISKELLLGVVSESGVYIIE